MVRAYFRNLILAVDQFANAVLGGDRDETISARLGKAKPHCRICRVLCFILSRIFRVPNHCDQAAHADPLEGRDEIWRL